MLDVLKESGRGIDDGRDPHFTLFRDLPSVLVDLYKLHAPLLFPIPPSRLHIHDDLDRADAAVAVLDPHVAIRDGLDVAEDLIAPGDLVP